MIDKNLDSIIKLSPAWLVLPNSFLFFLETNTINLGMWYIIKGDDLIEKINGLSNRYPSREIHPFARRDDNDDVACWKNGENEKIIVIHDYADSGWENRREFPTFLDWARFVFEDIIELAQLE